MKKLIFMIIICAGFMISEKTNAQFSFKVNISSQPMWGPVGYDYVQYYYLPDIEVYYNVSSRRYIYMERGRWISRSYLPHRYRNYDVYNTRKVVMNEPRPYLRHKHNHQRYSGSHEYSNQKSIRDSREVKYYQNKKHPEHQKWIYDNKHHKQNVKPGKKNNSKQKSDRNNRHNRK